LFPVPRFEQTSAGKPTPETEERKAMARVEESIEVGAPVSTVYNQWTQFEEFPRFMEGVEQVGQLDDKTLRWVAETGGERREWTAEIVEQKPDERIAWRALDASGPNGMVTFQSLGPDRSRATVAFEWEPEDMLEQLGSALGIDERRVKGDLERFKELIESRGVETGAWRGEIEGGRVTGEKPERFELGAVVRPCHVAVGRRGGVVHDRVPGGVETDEHGQMPVTRRDRRAGE